MNKLIISIGLCAFIILVPLIYGGTTLLPWTMARIATLLVFMGFFFSLVSKKVIEIRWLWIYLPILFCTAMCAGFLLFATNTWAAMQWSMNYACYFAVFITSAYCFGSDNRKLEKPHKIFIVCFAVSIIFQAGIGVTQLLGKDARASGTFVNPGYFGALMAAGASFFCAIILSPPDKPLFSGEKAGLNFICLLLALVGVCGAASSASRATALALLAGLFVAFWIRYRAKATIIVLVAVVLLLITPNPLSNRLQVLSLDIYAWERLNIWKSTLMLIQAHPFGIGQGNYRYWIQGYGFPVEQAFAHYGKSPKWAHSSYLQIAAELGPIAGLASVWMVLYFILGGLKQGIRLDNKTSLFVAPSAAALSTWAVTGLFDTIIVSPPATFLACIMAGIIFSNMIYKPKQENELRSLKKLELKLYPRFKLYALVVSIFFAVIIISPFTGWILSSEAGKNLEEGNIDESRRLYTKAMKLDSLNPQHPYDLSGLAFFNFKKTGNVEELYYTFDMFNRAIELNPMHSKYYLRLADCKVETARLTKDPDEAMKDAISFYHKALEINPTQPFYLNKLAIAYYKAGDFEQALKTYRRALSLEPNFALGRLNLARLLIKMDRKVEAMEELKFTRKTFNKAPKKPNDYELGLLNFNIREIEVLEELIRENGP